MKTGYSFPSRIPTNTALTICLVLLWQVLLTSCFTGVEGTKKISISRDDRKLLQPSAEEEFFRRVEGSPLGEWEKGRQFIAADNRTILIFDQEGLPSDPLGMGIGGKALSFEGIDTAPAPDGSPEAVAVFRLGDTLLRYDTGKAPEAALREVTSDRMPMLIDMKMVDSARSLLVGRHLWTKSPLWYDASGERTAGLRFVPVTITDVTAGNAAFPMKVEIKDSRGDTAWMMMNFGNSGQESRSFSNIFSLSDPRSRYPETSDEAWKMICRGRVMTGMTKQECRLALGNPSEVDSGHDYSQTLDLWHYPDGTVLWFEDGLLSRFRQ